MSDEKREKALEKWWVEPLPLDSMSTYVDAQNAFRAGYDACAADNAERGKAFRENPNEYRDAALTKYLKHWGAEFKTLEQSHAYKKAWDDCNEAWGPMWEMAEDGRERAESQLAEARATIERVRVSMAECKEVAAGIERMRLLPPTCAGLVRKIASYTMGIIDGNADPSGKP